MVVGHDRLVYWSETATRMIRSAEEGPGPRRCALIDETGPNLTQSLNFDLAADLDHAIRRQSEVSRSVQRGVCHLHEDLLTPWLKVRAV